MPIYAYRCDACGHQVDVLQKMADAPRVVCPACNASALRKQVTAAGFQLKGSGWYVTDFRDNGKGGAAAKKSADGEGSPAKPDMPAGEAASGTPSVGKDGQPASAPSSRSAAPSSSGAPPAASTTAAPSTPSAPASPSAG